MTDWLQRTELLIGANGLHKLKQANVLVVGMGGVGSFAAEFLCRAGIGRMTIVDGDRVDPSNKNRQIVALNSTVDVHKADVMSQRIQDINPEIQLTAIKEFLTPDLMMELVTTKFDWVLDCIDSLQPKLYFLGAAVTNGVKVVSSMGAGGRIDPQKVRIAPIFETDCCRFAYKVRKGLRRKGFGKANIIAVYSEELVNRESLQLTDGSNFKRSYYGTISYIPALFGINMASIVIRDLMQ
ncbi:MAG: tRNA threonylcarbamoyladenosine dehydratase [Pseudanabaena sp.]|jgi:tRNA A37 threonylcarbamoyladenosine dehydratase|uniref:tRNA threonylcarbamoyladenosine dehydratase n=1 Tax=Pseudanabaena mucicola TaxID=71190 RepID=UPI002576C6BD|nr:tRNA threonylcarbamoyladenosine dehydratase [Pseudanabaena mucicola]MCA6572269.1 tRNA threonylcarbamoyladenosine dehydratase [Pseudanabaena sp. M53BS1SP1A06MG]MCA6582994.1 tRNA threonylcarbamoyladenosine dehydratase [Pseudanabaena sp. M34BS1SP1A06MG]MCA6585204.1 tRNA threonylcarbamoyladenosine dehydratase [Pseudanabaena sp. M051S1SP1A06QC]MCA6588979.1 tRNA threonylcarbamoyladenosine dehydratase [Pseudanabaena sp. M109S1SP1A06QC]MCA6592673.1 tRNA threonylcarbamoyladenosine dehydratase [Pseud